MIFNIFFLRFSIPRVLDNMLKTLSNRVSLALAVHWIMGWLDRIVWIDLYVFTVRSEIELYLYKM